MLRENPQQRPNIYQVVAEVCSMRHRAIPIKDVCVAYALDFYLLRHVRSILAEPNLKTGGTSSYHLPNLTSLHHPLSWAYNALLL